MSGEDSSALGPPAAGLEIAWQNRAAGVVAGIGDLRPWLARLVADLAPEAASIGVRLVSRPEMRRLNDRFRGRKLPTDVLSFPGRRGPEGLHLGDLVICPAVARRQAEDAGHGLEVELKTLLLHGVLHCLGYDHDEDDGEMASLERRLRRRWVRDDP